MKARLHRICALALCLALLAALALPAMALQADDWALPELEQASQAGILPASLESADLTQRLTRQEMCQVVVHTFSKLVGKTLCPASTRHFTDTDNADICIAQELGIVSGYPDGTFRPYATITREEFCQVTIPAMNIALLRIVTWIGEPLATPQTPKITIGAVRLPINMASTCCMPRGMAVFNGRRPSSS